MPIVHGCKKPVPRRGRAFFVSVSGPSRPRQARSRLLRHPAAGSTKGCGQRRQEDEARPATFSRPLAAIRVEGDLIHRRI